MLNEVTAAQDRGVEVSIIYDGIESKTGPREKNESAIAQAGLSNLCKPRRNGRLMHNKFLVLCKDDAPQALLFGSTNLTENGIFGHANCVHIIEGAEPASTYLTYFHRLFADPETTRGSGYKAANEALTPAPIRLDQHSDTPVFSPRPDLAALDWYGDLANNAGKGLFMTFAFGMHPIFADVFSKQDDILRMALMEKEWNGRNRQAQIEKIRGLQSLPNVVIAVGNHIPLSGFDQWLGEMDRGAARVNVYWVHTKFMLADPLSENPIVITGSANFSKASTDTNDENMVVIRGNQRVADIYLGEFFRLHSHYAFRQAVAIFLQTHPGSSPEDFERRFLVEDGDWTQDYFAPGDRNARYVRRIYFSGS